MTRPMRKTSNQNGYKVFLGGLPANLTETDLRNFFLQYGKVSEVVIMYDQEKKKSRGESPHLSTTTFVFLSYNIHNFITERTSVSSRAMILVDIVTFLCTLNSDHFISP